MFLASWSAFLSFLVLFCLIILLGELSDNTWLVGRSEYLAWIKIFIRN